MGYVRKTEDEYHVEADYGYGDGFETVFIATTYAEAKHIYCDYLENDSDIRNLRIKKRRVKKEI